MLSQSAGDRSFKSNLLLASFTAFTAGMTNVAGVMACYSFTSNVTGHTAAFAQHMLKNNWYEMLVILAWIILFLTGAALSHFLIRSFEYRGPYFAHSLPIAVEIIILFGIALYGNHFHNETQTETTVITGALLLSMGIQNSAVSIISGGSIKTSHLTGLFTDLGGELAELLRPKVMRPAGLGKKLQLRGAILAFYLFGALAGGYLFLNTAFNTFYYIVIVLLFIVGYDVSKMKIKKYLSR